jgi:hypothetical protein
MKNKFYRAYVTASEPKKVRLALLIFTIVALAIAGAAPDAPEYGWVILP